MTRATARRALARGLALACCILGGVVRAAEPATVVIEAEAVKTASAKAYRDPSASGGKCAVVALDEGNKTLLVYKGNHAAGDYVLTVWLDAQPLATMHGLRADITAAGVTRTIRPVEFDGANAAASVEKSPTKTAPQPAGKGKLAAGVPFDAGAGDALEPPKPGGPAKKPAPADAPIATVYQPFKLRFTHGGGPLTVAINSLCAPTVDGIRTDNTAEEKAESRKLVPIEDLSLTDKPVGGAKEDKMFDLEEEQPITKLTYLDKRLVCDRLELTPIRTPPAIVAEVEVDKVHYFPDETVKAVARINGGAAGGSFKFVADDVTEFDQARRVFSRDVTVAAGQRVEVSFEYSLAGGPEFGHELRCALLDGEREVHAGTECFGVSMNVYRVAITGNDASGQDKTRATPESIRAGMLRNKKNYANHFEQFSWAPCSFSNLTPQTEEWFSGQTQYHGTKTAFKTMIDEAHRVGIKAFTYGFVCGGGIAALENYLRHPEIFASTDAGFSMSNTFLMERAYYNEYAFPDIPGLSPTTQWHFWQALWSASNDEAPRWGVDQIIGSMEMFGWDGVRWDNHWDGIDAQVKKRIREKFPRAVFGYNSCLAKPGDNVFLPPAKGVEDFHEIASNHGMMMDESVRLWNGTVRQFYEALAREADYVKRIGGLPLIITMDTASNQDAVYDVLCALAAGERYTYMNSPGHFAYGPLPRFLTRYSAFIWDDTARIADADKVVNVSVGRGPKGAAPWHDQTVWLRRLPGGKQQLLVNLLNPPGYSAFLNRVQPPPATLYDVAVSVPVPRGAKVTRVLHLSPDTLEGAAVLPMKAEGDRAIVSLPELRKWSIAAFEFESAGGGALPDPLFTLTTPIEDAKALLAKRAEEVAGEQQAKLAEAGMAKVEVKSQQLQYHRDFKRTFNADEEVAKKLMVLDDPRVRRNGTLDVLHCKGVFSWLNPVEPAVGLAGGGAYDSAWESYAYWRHADSGAAEDFPNTLVELLRYDVVVLDNYHARTLGPRRRAMIAHFVRNGGGLVIFGGVDNFSMGMDRNSALAELEPVEVVSRENLARDDKGMPLTPTAPVFFGGVDWSKSPQVYCMDISPLRPGVEVLAKAGDRPAIVRHNVGEGRVVAVLANPIGNYAESSLPYWKWNDWPRVIASCLSWAAGDFKAVRKPVVLAKKIDPREVNPDELAIESEMLDSTKFTKKLASASKNMVDAATARTVLTVAIEHADKVEDQEILFTIAEAASPYLDASFAPIAEKLVKSQHVLLRRVGYEVLGLSGDATKRARLEAALESDGEPANRRAALVAIGRIGSRDSIPAVRAYLRRKNESLLAMGVLKRLGDERAVAEGLELYGDLSWKALALRVTYWSQREGLGSGAAKRMTPAAWRQAEQKLRSVEQAMTQAEFDLRYFAQSLSSLSDEEVGAIADFLRATEIRPATSLAFIVCGRLDETRSQAFRRRLADAKFEPLRGLAAR